MSAAAPPVPPHRHGRVPPSSLFHDPSSAAAGDSRDLNSHARSPSSPVNATRGLPHVRDIAATAAEQVSQHASIEKLLERASVAIRQADTSLRFQRPDEAYKEYIVAATIVSEVIPHHKDQPMLYDRRKLGQAYQDLMSKIHREQARFDKVKDFIVQDNLRTGVQPRHRAVVGASQRASPSQRHDQRPASVYVGSPSIGSPGPTTPVKRNSVLTPFSQDGLGPPPPSPKDRPAVRPKPQELHGTALNASGPTTSVSGDALADRFSRLRANGALSPASKTTPNQSPTTWPAQINTFEHRSSVISPSDANGLGNFEPISRTTSSSSASNVNHRLSKALPKPPSPAYSPVRDAYGGSAVPPPRSMPRPPPDYASPMYATVNGSTEAASARTSQDSLGEAGAVDTQEVSVPRRAVTARRKSVNMPQETEISAERLYDYLKIFEVLLIDVRNRDEFDSGHIFSRNVVCVEPASLRPGMSADQLQDSLVLSPEEEQVAFDRRDAYDLVVYYDDATISTSFLRNLDDRQPGIAMKRLHQALVDFNQDKPLQWAPILLVGGITAWADLVGIQGLQSSTTVSVVRALRNRPTRPAARKSLPHDASRPTIVKKRHRDYNPLDAEEEQKWRERARSESVNLDRATLDTVAPAPAEDANAAYLREYEDFYQRYPDVAAVERQTMLSTPPPRPPPPPPPAPLQRLEITYPVPPTIPTVPSRPPPALPRPSYSGVSDRATPPAPVVDRAAQLPPYIPQAYHPRNIRLPRTGLHNFGVTCYMNSTMQCLSATLPLSRFFLNGEFRSRIQKDNWKGSKGLMPELYNTLLSNLWKGDVDTIRPTNFRKFCARLNSEWGLDRQQDAKEFLEFLVDYLHEDLNTNWARTPLRELTPQEEAIRERTPSSIASKNEWARYTHRDQSYLTNLFGGQHISRLRCTTCHNSSTTYEPFTSISVEIPGNTARVGIYDCLRSYCSAETLSGEEVWKCPHCKREREATKRITISRAPEFLIVHFKRFSASRTERAKKVHTQIEFPLHGLDLAPFMLDGGNIADGDAAMSPPYTYDAYAVMRHIGPSLTSGHYVALIRDPVRACWRKFDDDRVTDFLPEQLPRGQELQNEQAYIVFYQRVR